MSHLSQPSPNPSSSMLPHPSPSPSSLIPAPSPSGGPLSVPTPSPNPNPNPGSMGPTSVGATGMGSLGGGGHPSPFFHAADSSPAPVHSPWTQTGSVGSPGMSRPSPARLESRPVMTTNRVLPQRSWAGAIPTVLTHDALDVLCTPVTSVENSGGSGVDTAALPGHPCSPLERFLGSSYLRRQLQRIIQADDIKLEILDLRGAGYLLFRSPTMQFRVGHDGNHHQTLHLKITPVPEYADQWAPEEIQVSTSYL